ncbi:DUF2490 domain-containing protein [Sandaracinobacteroides hominis]|uniref:DUF2490 domain-containing protein n=1 Tax=Sandaracinobacteroides hominis TaxID=2780086 RepID=UPI0018F42574|nr:DUF2490 domain-containing protein [Sandaracinobacteroides hominis]
MIRLPGLAFALALAATIAARPALADDDAQLWLSYAASGQLKGELAGYFDTNARFYDNAGHLGHFQLRGGLGWRFAPGAIVGAGYSYVRTESLSGAVAHEHRIFEQASYPIAGIGKARLVGRTRLEHRMFEGSDPVAHRLRQQVRLNIPLHGPKGLQGIVHSEVYFLLNRPINRAPTGFNQIRTFAGLGIPLADTLTLEAGYLNQAIAVGDKPMNHAFSLGLVTRF